MRTCKRCNQTRELTEFREQRHICRVCEREQCKEYKKNHKLDIKQYNITYRKDHKEEIKQWEIVYRQKNKEKINKQKNMRDKQRRIEDPKFKLRQYISNSIKNMLIHHNSSKFGRSVLEFIPYSIQELKQHLESLFEDWMSWKNHGAYRVATWNDNDQSTWTWQIDHIIPHSAFPYTIMEDPGFQECWALKNLRPLSAKQNILDGDRNHCKNIKKS